MFFAEPRTQMFQLNILLIFGLSMEAVAYAAGSLELGL